MLMYEQEVIKQKNQIIRQRTLKLYYKEKEFDFMKKLLSIFLTALMLISSVIISVGAINSDSTKPESISMTVYDVETGEETVEEYQIDPEIIKALSSKAVATAAPTIMSSPSMANQTISLLTRINETVYSYLMQFIADNA